MKLTNHIIKTTLTAIVLSISAGFVTACSSASSRWEEDSTADSLSLEPETAEEPDTVALPSYIHYTAEEARHFMTGSPDSARYARGIIPRMTEDCPAYAEKLLNNTHGGFIVVDKGSMNVILFDRFGVERKAYPMACAKNYGTKHERRDGRTPEGFFSVKSIHDSTEWLFTDDDGNTSDIKGQFGPRFIRIDTPVSTQIGIHGTCAPWSIGGRRSHGCIRITNENILELVELVERGMPVIINPGPRDEAVNEHEGFVIPVIYTGHARKGKKVLPPQPAETVPEPQPSATDSTPAVTLPPDTVPLPKGGAPDTIPSDTENVIFPKN